MQSGLVFNTIFATLILGEAFTRYSLVGTILVCIGAVMIATFGAIGEPAHTLDQLLELLARPAFIAWMICTGVTVALMLLSIRILKLLATPSRIRNIFWKHRFSPTIHWHSPRSKVIRGMLYGSVSGILSAHSLLVAKSAVELLVRTLAYRVNQFNRWQSWVILLGLVALALTQLYYMHRGLKLCSTSILYPFVFCIYNVIAILDGLIYFHQASKLSALHAGLIALGTVVLLSGVLCLSWRLEEISTTAAVGPPPAPLTPGLGLLDEDRSEIFYPDDEESQLPGERQPLLRTSHETPSPTARYTLPRLSTTHRRSTTASIETAEIWAELADDEEEASDLRDSAVHPPSSPLSPLRRFSRRHRRAVSIPSGNPSSPLFRGAHTSYTDDNDNEQSSPLLPQTQGPGPNGHSHDTDPTSSKPTRLKPYPRLTFHLPRQNTDTDTDTTATRHNHNYLRHLRRTSSPLVFAESSSSPGSGERDRGQESGNRQRDVSTMGSEARGSREGGIWEAGRRWVGRWIR